MHATWHILPIDRINPKSLQILLGVRDYYGGEIMKNGLSFTQIVVMLLLTNGLMNHVIVIPMMLDSAKRDSWISVLLAGVLYLLWTGLLYSVYKKTENEHLFHWIKKTYGFPLYCVLALLTCVYCFTIATMTMTDTITWVNLSFAPETPLEVHTILFAVLCLVNAMFGIRSIAMTSSVLLPFVVLLGFFVMSTNFPNKDYSLLLPMMENGIAPVLRGMMYAGTGFVELILLLFMQHHLQSRVPYYQLFILAFVIIGLTFGPTLGAIVEFGPDKAGKLRYPAYEEWRLANIGLYIEHLDTLSIYQWFSGAFTRISLSLLLIVEILMIPYGKKRIWWLIGLFSLSSALSRYPISAIQFYSLLSKKLLPSLFVLALSLSIVFALLTAFASRRKQHDES
ncbi:endospore germination permease [Brevibacillus sp. FIR094]|uniref:endospore germination permease n=1 Tax=Brevibacillus sp. FIR094 TaxID=3134809 RepID=UPI003D200D60